MTIAGKRILLTGASGGFGRAIAHELMVQGATVVGIDLNVHGTDFQVLEADISIDSDVRSASSQAIAALGGLDVLINNAGINGFEDPGVAPTAVSHRKLNVNFFGPWRVTASVLPELLRTEGRVINIASVGAYAAFPYLPSYAASKRALASYSDTLRLMYGDRIKVITAYPSYMRTGIHDISVKQGFWPERMYATRIGKVTVFTWEERVEDAARGIARLCSGRAPRDTGVTWKSSLILYGARHAPALVDWTVRERFRRLFQAGMRLDVDSTSTLEEESSTNAV